MEDQVKQLKLRTRKLKLDREADHRGDARTVQNRELSNRMTLREPHLQYHPKKRGLKTRNLRFPQTDLGSSLTRGTSPSQRGTEVPQSYNRRPTIGERGKSYSGDDIHGLDERNEFGSVTAPGGPLGLPRSGGAPFRQPQPYSQSSATGYEYRQERVLISAPTPNIGQMYAVSAMNALQSDPNSFFPFQVLGHQGEQEILKGHFYDLMNRENSPLSPMPPGRFPVQVTEKTPNSFTFTTFPGHFDSPGSTITFYIWADPKGTVHLGHLGIAEPSADQSLKFIVAPYVAAWTWDQQANNLRRWLEQENNRLFGR